MQTDLGNVTTRRTVQIVGLAIVVLLAGTAGFYFIEKDFTLFEAFYMTVITVSTVGFGELRVLSVPGRIFTMALIISGIGVLAMAATQVTRIIVERETSSLFGRGKMDRKIKKMNGHCIICGYGRIGRAICSSLSEDGVPFVILDTNADSIEAARRMGYAAVLGNASHDITLGTAGIKKASGISVCTANDAENLYITLSARELNPSIYIIARGDEGTVEERMYRAGADTVVYPMRLGGEQIAALIVKQSGGVGDENRMKDPGIMGYSLQVFRYYSNEKKTVADIVKRTGAVKVLALRYGSRNEVVDNPSDDTAIMRNDSLVLLVNKRDDHQATVNTKQMVWSDEMSVHVPEIDEEHRHIVSLVNRLDTAILEGRGIDVLAEVFDRLLEYTTEHFSHEETLFLEWNYPDAEAHKKEHAAIRQRVLDLNKERKYVFPDNISDFLYDWIKRHIMVTDRKYRDFLDNR